MSGVEKGEVNFFLLGMVIVHTEDGGAVVLYTLDIQFFSAFTAVFGVVEVTVDTAAWAGV